MMQLKIVETPEEEQANIQEDKHGQLHGTKIMLRLLKPWYNDGERVVCRDSYFASVTAVKVLKNVGFRLIGVIKTATKQYPIAHLQNVEINERRDSRALLSKDKEGKVDALALLWVDCNQRYFITNAQGVEESEPLYCIQ